jgi:hypothetical protein
MPIIFDSNSAKIDCKSTMDDPKNRSQQWRGSAKMPFTDSTRDTNYLRNVSAELIDADTCDPSSGNAPTLKGILLSFTAELPDSAFDSNGDVTPAAMNNNFLRLAIRGKAVPQAGLPDAQPYFAVSLPIVSASMGNGDGWPVPVTFILTNGRNLCDRFSSICAAKNDYLGDSTAGRDDVLSSAIKFSNSIQPTAISWFNAPSGAAPGFMVIQMVLPLDLMAVDEDSGAFPFWYGIDLASPATNQTGTNYSNVTYGDNSYSMGFSWPTGPSLPANGGEPDLDRTYPAIDNWGLLVLEKIDSQTKLSNCKGISLESSSIAADGNQAPFSLLARPIFNQMKDQFPDADSLKIFHPRMYVAPWGSTPFPSDGLPPGPPWEKADFAGFTNLTDISIGDGTGGYVSQSQSVTANWTYTPTSPPASPFLPGLLVEMSADIGFFYINNNILNNAAVLSASKINAPATITIKGLAPLPNKKATRNVYFQVVPTNMPKYQDSNPLDSAGKGDGKGNDLAGNVARVLAWLSSSKITRSNQLSYAMKTGTGAKQAQASASAASQPATTSAAPVPLDVESIRYGVSRGNLSANHVHELLAAGLIRPETLEAALPIFRVRVFHDTGAKVKWVDQDKRDRGLHDVVEAQSAFSFVAVHKGPTTGWRYSLTLDDKVPPLPAGAKIVAVPGDPNRFMIQGLPNDSTFQLSAYVEAVEPHPLSVGLLLGVAVPNGGFSSSNKAGPAVTITVEREVIGHMVSVVGHIGVENMPGKTPSPTASVREFGAGAKIYLQRPADWRPYLLPTLNQYRIGSAGTKAGPSLGLGLQRELTPEWSLDFRYGTHWISSNSPQSRFSTLQAGARYSF